MTNISEKEECDSLSRESPTSSITIEGGDSLVIEQWRCSSQLDELKPSNLNNDNNVKQLPNDQLLTAEDQNKNLTPSANVSTAARESNLNIGTKEDFLRDELIPRYEVVSQLPLNLSHIASNSQIRLNHGRLTSIDNMEHIEKTDITPSVHSPLLPEEFSMEGERRSRMEPDGARNPSPDNITILTP